MMRTCPAPGNENFAFDDFEGSPRLGDLGYAHRFHNKCPNVSELTTLTPKVDASFLFFLAMNFKQMVRVSTFLGHAWACGTVWIDVDFDML